MCDIKTPDDIIIWGSLSSCGYLLSSASLDDRSDLLVSCTRSTPQKHRNRKSCYLLHEASSSDRLSSGGSQLFPTSQTPASQTLLAPDVEVHWESCWSCHVFSSRSSKGATGRRRRWWGERTQLWLLHTWQKFASRSVADKKLDASTFDMRSAHASGIKREMMMMMMMMMCSQKYTSEIERK